MQGVRGMAYARLDIYFPDGHIETHFLSTPTVSVGRAPSNTIVLDTDTVSRHHFSITYKDGIASVTDLDSENGTLIDGVPLQSNQPYQMDDVEELQAGYLRLIYQTIDESITQPHEAVPEDTQPVHRNKDFIVSTDYQSVKVWPASSTSLEITVQNMRDTSRRFRLVVSGLPSEWLRVNRPEFEVLPNEGTPILLNIKPPRRPDVKPHVYQMLIEVQPHDTPEEIVRMEVAVDVRSYSGFGIALSQTLVETDDRLLVHLHNHGSDELTIALKGRTSTSLSLGFSMPRVTLAAGARSQVAVKFTPRQRPLFGNPQTFPFTVMASAQNASRFVAALGGKTTIEPLLPRWAMLSFIGVIGGLLLALMLTLAGVFTPPANPQIFNLNAQSALYEQGDSIRITWQARDTERINILVNQTLRATLEGNTTSYDITTDTLDGRVTIILQAQNRGVVTEEFLEVSVYRQMEVALFRATPARVFANVLTPLEVAWNVNNAVTTRLEGLEVFTNAPVPAEFIESGTETFSGFAEQPFTLTLHAKDVAGNELSQVLVIEVIAPTCTNTNTITLYEGPDPRYNAVAKLATASTLTLRAQDSNSGWLKASTANGNGWVARDGLDCVEGFALDDLLQEVNTLSLPTPTLTPTLTPSVTPAPTNTPAPRTTP